MNQKQSGDIVFPFFLINWNLKKRSESDLSIRKLLKNKKHSIFICYVVESQKTYIIHHPLFKKILLKKIFIVKF